MATILPCNLLTMLYLPDMQEAVYESRCVRRYSNYTHNNQYTEITTIRVISIVGHAHGLSFV